MRLQFLKANANWLGIGCLLTFISSFGQTFFISIFAGDIRSTFDLSHGSWGVLYAIGTSASAVVMIWTGVLSDTFRVRELGSFVFLGLGIACLMMSFVTAVWMLPFIIFALRFCGQGMSSHLASVAMVRWFVSNRGKALAISGLGLAFGEAVLPAVFVALLTIFEWRELWLIAACIAGLGALVIWTTLRQERTPQQLLHEESMPGLHGRHWQRSEVLCHPLFWVMMPALLGLAAFVTAIFFQQVHLAEIKGWDHFHVVAMFPAYTLAGVGAMLASGWAVDRYGAKRIIGVYLLPIAVSFLCFSLITHEVLGHVSFVLMGLSAGAGGPLFNSFWAEMYGTRYLGAIKAAASAALVFGSAIGPSLTGLLIDFGLSFEQQCFGIALWFLFASVIMSVGIRRYAVSHGE